ncbi:MAG: spore germination protein, partial [Clostridia bacterium]
MQVSKKININEFKMDSSLDLKNNYDIIKKHIKVGSKQGCFYYIDGFLKEKIMTNIMEAILKITPEQISSIKTAEEFSSNFLNYPEIEIQTDFNMIFQNILSGCLIFFIDDFDQSIIIDIRKYPNRSIEEPENDKVLRGAKDGFIETPIVNIALIRRRIRSLDLKVEYFNLGEETHSDVVICYMQSKVDGEKLENLKNKISNLKVKSLTNGSQSLIESLSTKKWINPFPKVKFTSRPDIAASNLLEGRIILMADNTPSVAIVPTFILDFFQEAEDYYFPPPTGNFIRFTRILLAIISTFVTPLWLLAIKNLSLLPTWLAFLEPKEMAGIPTLIQLLFLEFSVEALRAASVNTPAMISTSVALIGTIIIGDIAVVSKIIMPEALLFTAFATIGFYCQSSFEFGYALKYVRMMLLILVGLFNFYGLAIGIIITILMMAFNKTITKDSFIYPLIPFNFKDLKK